ncbi:hypothetical protein [Streptomyces sp. AC602_WCS936]|uniref:hypothetical protein n=1 Tax=Streptomyces sp. AC602_WCS936 TaxID=2823685 RepID=UPI001C276324|nr:hypothetical protein [Streptomyces sp. AC602_WCS936]
MQKRPEDRWGVLVFKGDDGQDLLHVPLAGWLPEARCLGALDLRPHKCLDRTGLRQLVKRLGIPLEESPEPVTASGVPDDGRGSRPYRVVHTGFPRGCTKGISLFGWLIAFVIGFATENFWALTVAAGALFLLPAGDASVRARGWWCSRQHARFVDKTEIRPSPAAGSGVTRRFLRTAAVRVYSRDVVLTNALGEERWLGRAGAHGVARLVRLVDAATGESLGVEVWDRQGEVRALLPWRFWFAGPLGSESWTALTEALKVPVSDEKYRRRRNAQHWWEGHALAGDARRMSPIEGRAVRREVAWYSSVAGADEPVVIPFFSAWLLFGLMSDKVPVFLAGLLSALTIVLSLGLATVSALVSRISYDRTVQAE